MNTYETKFFSRCPTNRVRILYSLTIKTHEMLMVENIIDVVESFDEGYHEEIAEALREKFGGLQTLAAEHHGVIITTHRSGVARGCA